MAWPKTTEYIEFQHIRHKLTLGMTIRVYYDGEYVEGQLFCMHDGDLPSKTIGMLTNSKLGIRARPFGGYTCDQNHVNEARAQSQYLWAFRGNHLIAFEGMDPWMLVQPTTKVTVGSDPEFYMVGYDGRNHNIGHRKTIFGSIGEDHGGSVVEVRPKHGTPLEHARNTTGIIQEMLRYAPDSKVYVSTRQKSLGGHIHFGIPKHTSSINDALAYNLDYWLALTAFPLFPRDHFLLRLRQYGRLTEWRSQPHGFEYRTLPNFHVSPEITLAVFTLAHSIVELTLKRTMKVRNKKKDRLWVAQYNTHAVQETHVQRVANIQTLLHQRGLARRLKVIQPLFDAILGEKTYDLRKPLRYVGPRNPERPLTLEELRKLSAAELRLILVQNGVLRVRD